MYVLSYTVSKIRTSCRNMGNNISSSIIPPPLSLNDCIVNGDLDLLRYYMYKRRRRIQSLQRTALDEIVKVKRKFCDDCRR